MIKKIFRRIFRRKNTVPISSQTEELNSISFWTAGIKFDSRLDNLLACRIKDPVYFIREPENEIDKNAIHIRTTNGASLGYVGKHRAALLAPMFDATRVDGIGYIVELKSDLKDELYGVKICLPVSEAIFSELKGDKLKQIEYVFETSSRNNLYILLNSEEAVFVEVKKLLEEGGVLIDRTGISYALSKSGRRYNWYLRIDNDSDKNTIDKLLRENFPVLKEDYDKKINEEYVELQEEELQTLATQKKIFKEKIISLEESLAYYEKREQLYDNQFDRMLDIFLSNVIFVRDSVDVLKKEVEDYTTALSKISEICNDPLFKGRKINTLNKWFEIHFNTGQKDDGRIYFKREGAKLNVLVSFKTSQKKDIQYLRN